MSDADTASRSDTNPEWAIGRREVLIAAGAVTVLTACGGSTEADNAGSADDAGTGAPAPEDTGATAATGTVLASTADVPVGGGVILAEPKVVITQPAAGEFKAFSAICPHQVCPVNTVQANVIGCPCHQSQFDASDGSVIGGPAPSGLAVVPIEVDGDQILSAGG